jgi:hypothetical protein
MDVALAVQSAWGRTPAPAAHLKELEDVAQRFDIQVVHA